MELNAYIIQVGAYLIVNRRIFMLKYKNQSMSLRANCEKFEHWGTTLIKTNKQTIYLTGIFSTLLGLQEFQGFQTDFQKKIFCSKPVPPPIWSLFSYASQLNVNDKHKGQYYSCRRYLLVTCSFLMNLLQLKFTLYLPGNFFKEKIKMACHLQEISGTVEVPHIFFVPGFTSPLVFLNRKKDLKS